MISSNSLIDKREHQFRRLALLTVVVIYLLILAGGIVRGTGSGMGCPDWPTCFGRLIPPTEVSQLPPNYKAIYGAKLKGEVEFNAVKTWIEYVNRLLGVLSGFFVLGTLVASFQYLKKDRSIFWGSLIAFLMIGVNGWLGSRVVATELAQHMITLHLLLAIVVVFALLFVWVRSDTSYFYSTSITTPRQPLRWLLLGVMSLTLVQIVLGTEVRDALDTAVKQLGYGQRDKWVSHLDWSFYVHRSFSLLVLLAQLSVVYQLRKNSKAVLLTKLAKVLVILIIASIATGVIMAYLDVPAVAQPIHLVLAVLMIGVEFVAWLLVNPELTESFNHDKEFRFVKA